MLGFVSFIPLFGGAAPRSLAPKANLLRELAKSRSILR
jgi:hypothetical protein